MDNLYSQLLLNFLRRRNTRPRTHVKFMEDLRTDSPWITKFYEKDERVIWVNTYYEEKLGNPYFQIAFLTAIGVILLNDRRFEPILLPGEQNYHYRLNRAISRFETAKFLYQVEAIDYDLYFSAYYSARLNEKNNIFFFDDAEEFISALLSFYSYFILGREVIYDAYIDPRNSKIRIFEVFPVRKPFYEKQLTDAEIFMIHYMFTEPERFSEEDFVVFGKVLVEKIFSPVL